jgi:hypothetical protein
MEPVDIRPRLGESRAMTRHVNVTDATAGLSAPPRAVEAGDDVTVTRRGLRGATPCRVGPSHARTAGDWGWTDTFDPALFAPMSDAEISAEGWPD